MKLSPLQTILIVSVLGLFSIGINNLGSLEEFERQDLHIRINSLNKAWNYGSISNFLKEKNLFREKLISLYKSKLANPALKKDIISLMVFMFPEDVKDDLLVNNELAQRMQEIEKYPNQYQAKLEYMQLERETYTALSGAYDDEIPTLHKKILNIYRNIAGIDRTTFKME